MKTVLIVGSPHPRGNSAAMAERFCAALGGGVRRFDAYTADVGPCTDCGRCGREAGCTIRDGAAELLSAIDAADVIVLASPVYFSDLPGPLVSMASRLQYLWMRRRAGEAVLSPKARRGIILLSGGGSGRPDRALANARCWLHMLGAEVSAEIASLNTDSIPAAQDADAMHAIDTAAEKVREGLGL